MNISHYSENSFPNVKRVLVYLNGTYPPKNGFYVEKDLNLPARLYPNAEFIIRCNIEKMQMQTMMFFKKLYKDKKLHFVSDKEIYDNANVDVIWFIHFNFIFFGGKIDKYSFAKWQVIQNFKGKVHILFNEEGTPAFEPMYDYTQRRNDNFKKLNEEFISKITDKKDWSNVTLLCNDDRIEQWVNDRVVDKCKEGGISLCYLTDKVLYDLPSVDSISCNVTDMNGIYIGNISPKRISCFNKFFDGSIENFKIMGPHSDELSVHRGEGKSIDNKLAKQILKYAGWSVYIGKGAPSLYLGATFYEPLLNGIPLFIWLYTDEEHKIFPEMPECYFKNESELKKKIANCDIQELRNLWKKQIEWILK